MGRRIRKITVTGIGTPPPLPLRPLVDEVLRAWDARQRAQARPEDRAAAARSSRGTSESAAQVGADPLG